MLINLKSVKHIVFLSRWTAMPLTKAGACTNFGGTNKGEPTYTALRPLAYNH